MHAIKGKFRKGQVVLAEKADWPEETEVLVEPIAERKTLGIREEDWPTDPDGLAKLLALIDSLEPLDMTSAEEAEWRAALKAQNEFDRSKDSERLEQIKRSFE